MCYQSHNWSIFHHPCHKIFSLASLGIPQVIQLKHNFSWRLKNKCSISECLKFIEVKSNALFLSTFGVKIDVKNKRKESLECVRMHIWASKTQKLPGPLSGPWTPAAECSRDSASLCRQLSASEAGAPPWPNPGSAPEIIIHRSKLPPRMNILNSLTQLFTIHLYLFQLYISYFYRVWKIKK